MTIAAAFALGFALSTVLGIRTLRRLHFKRHPDAQHTTTRVWSEWELEAETPPFR